MSKCVEVIALVEGQTERNFIMQILAPALAPKGVFVSPIIASKPGQRGGDIKFVRVARDLRALFKQRANTYLTLFVDYYGLKSEWPGLEEAKKQKTAGAKAERIYGALTERIGELGLDRATERFIPYVSMHELEGLLFSDPEVLAAGLGVARQSIDAVLAVFENPEEINDAPETAPSKRLTALFPRYKKTVTGINLARTITLAKMREACPNFHQWVSRMEQLEEL